MSGAFCLMYYLSFTMKYLFSAVLLLAGMCLSAQDTLIIKGKVLFVDTSICYASHHFPLTEKRILVEADSFPKSCKKVGVLSWYTGCNCNLKIGDVYTFHVLKHDNNFHVSTRPPITSVSIKADDVGQIQKREMWDGFVLKEGDSYNLQVIGIDNKIPSKYEDECH